MLTPDFQSNLMLDSRSTTLVGQGQLQQLQSHLMRTGDPYSSKGDYLAKYEQDLKDLSVIGLSRPRDDGQRFVAVGGKSDLSVLRIRDAFGDSSDADELVICD